MLVIVCPEDIFWTTEYFVTKPGMPMQHHKPEYHAEKLVHCVQCQGHSEGLYNQNMIISAVSSKLLVGLQPNLVWLYNIISQNVLLKNGITAFKVVQNVSECLSWWYFLCVSDCVCSVSPEPLNHFLPNLVLWCTIMRWCFVRKIGSLSLMSMSQQGHI